MLRVLYESFIIGVVGIVFTDVLMLPGMILDWYARLIEYFPDWLKNPLGGCVFCFTGQLALWMYLIMHFHSYDFLNHVSTVMLSIFVTLIYTNIWKSST